MNSTQLVRRITELEEGSENRTLKVKVRVQVGNRVEVLDLDPDMVQMKDWGSDRNSVLVIDLA